MDTAVLGGHGASIWLAIFMLFLSQIKFLPRNAPGLERQARQRYPFFWISIR